MQTRKKYEKGRLSLKGDVSSMLRKAKTVLSDRQYRELCRDVNDADDYNEKKGMITAAICAEKKYSRRKAVG